MGLGTARTKTYELSEPGFYYDSGYIMTNQNINFGLIRQTNSNVSWQIGVDTAIRDVYNTPGLNLAIGLTID